MQIQPGNVLTVTTRKTSSSMEVHAHPATFPTASIATIGPIATNVTKITVTT